MKRGIMTQCLAQNQDLIVRKNKKIDSFTEEKFF